ncbi:MAG: hypothetical protein GX567_07275 [Clostridia bacterium]|nr:hypothetical protein [Clostridia bacterium]
MTTVKNATPGYYYVRAEATDGTGKYAAKRILVVESGITKITSEINAAKLFRTAGAFNAQTSAVIRFYVTGGNSDAVKFENTNEGIVRITDIIPGTGYFDIYVASSGGAIGKSDIVVASTDGSNKKAKCSVTVVNPVSKVNIAPKAGGTDLVAQGKSLQLNATLTTEYGTVSNKGVDWSISEGIPGLKISKTGKVTTTAATPNLEYYYVTATAKDGSNASATYTIRVNPKCTYMGFGELIPIQGGAIIPIELYFEGGQAWKPRMVVNSSNDKVCIGEIRYIEGGQYLILHYQNVGKTTLTVSLLDGSNKKIRLGFTLR